MENKDMKKDRVSVITTFYNAADFILNAINSVVMQQVDDSFEIEYVLVNDKSPDNSLNLVNAYKASHQSCGIIWNIVEPEENLGCGGARRFGIQSATGNYFMFLDADDYYINKDFIKRAHHDIIAEEADVVEYGLIYNQSNGSQNKSVASKKYVLTDTHTKEIALFKDNLIKFNVWTKIYRRSVVESYLYSDSRTFEDVRTIPVWISNAGKIVVMPSIEINYRAASNSIIRNDWNKTRLGTISAIASHFERFKDDFDVLKAMYGRSMIDLEALLNNHSSENDGFNEMSKLNTYMLKYLYPDTWQDITYEV